MKFEKAFIEIVEFSADVVTTSLKLCSNGTTADAGDTGFS